MPEKTPRREFLGRKRGHVRKKNGKFGDPHTKTSTKRSGEKRYNKIRQSKLKMRPEICWILTNKGSGSPARTVG
jgi:hypothetical protein